MTNISKVGAPGGSPLSGAVSVYTDGVSITGNGTKEDPLKADGGGAFQNVVPSSATPETILPGMPLTPQTFGGYKVVPAIADGSQTGVVVGLATEGNGDVASAPVTEQYGGTLTLTEAQWSAIAGGSTGLSPGHTYYVSDSVAGNIQASAPTTSGHQIIQLGVAISNTELQLLINAPFTHP